MSPRPSVYVAGYSGMVGRALTRKFRDKGYPLLFNPGPRVDFRDQRATRELIGHLKPEWMVLAAAKVGGIYANTQYPADFIYDNLMMQANLLRAAADFGVRKLLFLASSCVYPRLCPQPMKEEYLLSGLLEPTNEPYAIAKISGIVMAKAFNRQFETNFISILPPNLYGPGDSFNLENSHVISALIRKMDEAKDTGRSHVQVWGTGSPRREFLFVEDLADACLFLMENYDSTEIINVGAGRDITVRDLAGLIKKVVGFEGDIEFDPSMPDGMPAKLLDISKITALGWRPNTGLERGLEFTYQYYLEGKSPAS